MLEVTSAGNAADGLGPAHVQNTIQICICACLPNTQKSITRLVMWCKQVTVIKPRCLTKANDVASTESS